MYAGKFTWHASCPRHPRYDPRRGLGAIRGGCVYCGRLVDMMRAVESAQLALRRIAQEIEGAPAPGPQPEQRHLDLLETGV